MFRRRLGGSRSCATEIAAREDRNLLRPHGRVMCSAFAKVTAAALRALAVKTADESARPH